MPIAFAVIEPDYDIVDEAFAALGSAQAAAASQSAEAWLNAELWRAVAQVNEGWSAACRVHRAAVIVLGRHDEPLPVSRKKLVYRVLAEKRFADELKARTALILGSTSSRSAPRERPVAETLPSPAVAGAKRAETLHSLRECLAQVLAVPVTSLAVSSAEADGTDDQPFASLGLSSLLAVRLAGLVTERFGVNVTAATLYTHITLSQLATFLLASQAHHDYDNTEAPTPTLSHTPDREPVAITGMSCRFPGGADDLESYWELLKNGVDGITEVPSSRWDIEQLYDADSDAPGKMHNRRGGFVGATERFDHRFFGISEHEATSGMDPRQRVALELVWEALETAGIPPRSLAGSRTGVFVALMDSPFQETLLAAGPPDLQFGTGGTYTHHTLHHLHSLITSHTNRFVERCGGSTVTLLQAAWTVDGRRYGLLVEPCRPGRGRTGDPVGSVFQGDCVCRSRRAHAHVKHLPLQGAHDQPQRPLRDV
jgi:acyl carrier protein